MNHVRIVAGRNVRTDPRTNSLGEYTEGRLDDWKVDDFAGRHIGARLEYR